MLILKSMANKINNYKLTQEIKSSKINNFDDFLKWKRKISKKLNTNMISNIDILSAYKQTRATNKINIIPFFENQLKKRPVRSLSGVAVVAVLTKQWPCPGDCIYCPTEAGIPKSYLSGEPAVERAKLLDFDPYKQVVTRIKSLKQTGHPVDKIELIVIGGTWSYLPKQYQIWFIKKCFDAANQAKSKTLLSAQKKNETAKHRIIGLTLETRPDYINKTEIKRMRKLGCTRVEIGVQSVYDDILEKNNRGHKTKEIIKATKLLKNSGFKICYHMMPGLLGSSIKKDLAMFKQIFTNPVFQPDMLKIYPCVITKGSKLFDIWKNNNYKPYTDEQLIDLIIKIKSITPRYVRINRLIRDIPAWQIEAGSKTSNLREIIQEKMKDMKLKCKCIRCREIKDKQITIKNLKLLNKEYTASDGQEIWLSFNDTKQDKLAAFIRLRLPTNSSTALIRELHTYGQLIEIDSSKQPHKATQHLGLGKKLILAATKIAKQRGCKKMSIIAGIGTREYYRKLGYRLKNTYMIKSL